MIGQLRVQQNNILTNIELETSKSNFIYNWNGLHSFTTDRLYILKDSKSFQQNTPYELTVTMKPQTDLLNDNTKGTTYSIYLVQTEQIEDQVKCITNISNAQVIKKDLPVYGEEINETILFSPITDMPYNAIMVFVNKTIVDFGEESDRYRPILDLTLNEVNNVISGDPYSRVGLWNGNPRKSFLLNGEELKFNKMGMFEIDVKELSIYSLGFINESFKTKNKEEDDDSIYIDYVI